FQKNDVTGRGGGAFFKHVLSVKIRGGNVTENNAKRGGGGLAVLCGNKFEVKAMTFSNNHSEAEGGGVFIVPTKGDLNAFFEDCVFEHNRSDGPGGGAALACEKERAVFRFHYCKIRDNKALKHGAGLSLRVNSGGTGRSEVELEILGGKIGYNITKQWGGGVFVQGGEREGVDTKVRVRFEETPEIVGNQADEFGGGVLLMYLKQTCTMKGVELRTNRGIGAAMVLEFASVKLEDCAIRDNVSTGIRPGPVVQWRGQEPTWDRATKFSGNQGGDVGERK
ncbi:MAG: right-handed parallel beta-helix repeat-containing protein, partial [Planctomycetota bacterium]